MASTTSPSPPLLLLLFLCFFSLSSKTHLAIAAETLSANQSLSGSQTIISKGGNFELGFFSPANTSNFYIAIWYSYKKVSKQTVVWVANRDRPLSSSFSSELRISEDGNLVLLDGSKNLFWSTNLTSPASNSTVAEILDTGNLVLRDGSDPNSVLWQSTDHPTDTLLQGGKVGINRVTKVNQILTSWRNSDDPGSGIYSLEIDPNGSSLCMQNPFARGFDMTET
ncbi:G-type lectin S-receptor-like serine/threonine-protein kinase [Acorus calamus]|uniref:G-type lectin S-receptor-like serine/threonine-protein kinase n=1 Tax=Acorus calamus TaxID=4465 RepID=A0AAV9C4L6_ACOCL|nr:G-type lectin S-receptor-like serine/threonine-protein kinase [Acorus calamus]